MRPYYVRDDQGGLRIPLWLVALLALGFVLFGLGSFAILDNNEGLYAEIPREMLASHDWRMWVIPHLNGLPYMEKPPLLYWLTACSFALFGESEWSARLVPALSSLACVTLLVWFGNAVRRPLAGRLAALMFVTGLGVMAMSHVLMFDMLLTALLAAALMYAYRFVSEQETRFLRRGYAALALALLAKGLVALVLFGLVMGLFTLLSARSVGGFFRAMGKWFNPSALLVLIVIAAPWHVAASLTEPVFAWFYFINEHVLRFLGKREPHDYYAGAWWYYLPRMAIYLFPWSFILPCLLVRARGESGEGDHDEGHGGQHLSRFLWLAWLAPLAFFSVSSAKANYYLLTVMPFAAFHLALALEKRGCLHGLVRTVPGVLIGLLAGLGGAAIAMRTVSGAPDELFVWGMSQTRFLMVATGGMSLLALAGAVIAWRVARIGLLAYLALPVWTLVLLMTTLPVLEPTISTRATAGYLQGALKGHKVYLYRDFEQQSSLPFYLKQVLPVIDARSNDLFWGNKLREQNTVMISADAFAARLPQESVAVIVMDRQMHDFRGGVWMNAFKGEKRIGATTIFFN